MAGIKIKSQRERKKSWTRYRFNGKGPPAADGKTINMRKPTLDKRAKKLKNISLNVYFFEENNRQTFE